MIKNETNVKGILKRDDLECIKERDKNESDVIYLIISIICVRRKGQTGNGHWMFCLMGNVSRCSCLHVIIGRQIQFFFL